MERKQDIRKRIIQLRDAQPDAQREEKSRLIQEALFCNPVYTQAAVVLCYADFSSEVKTGRILQRALEEGKEVYCPKVFGKTMDFYRIRSTGELKKGAFGIREPEGLSENRFAPWENSSDSRVLIIMPGCVFDESGHRIGYGGGYYDRFLSRLPEGHRTAALAFELQLLPEIPFMEHDIRPELIFTEKRVRGAGYGT